MINSSNSTHFQLNIWELMWGKIVSTLDDFCKLRQKHWKWKTSLLKVLLVTQKKKIQWIDWFIFNNQDSQTTIWLHLMFSLFLFFSINCNYSNVTVLCTHSLCLFTDTDESFLAHCAVFKAMNYSKDGKAGDQDLVVQKGWCWRCLVFLENIEYLYRKNLMTC